MASEEFSLRAVVEIAGSPLQHEHEVLLERVLVDHQLHTPDMFVLTFRDANREVVEQLKVKIGSKVKISALPLGGSTPERLISGEVTALEAEYSSAGSRSVVRGYDESHRLHSGRETQTYSNVKDSDIAKTIANRHGLQVGTIDDSPGTHDLVPQFNQSDWDFMNDRAQRIGREFFVDDGKVHFKKPTPSSDAPGQGNLQSSNPLQLVYGQNLVEFSARVNSAEQVKDVKTRSYDPETKQALIGSAAAGSSSASLPTAPGSLAENNGNPTFTSVLRPLLTQGAVDAQAQAISDVLGSSAGEAEGTVRGNPKLRAGVAVSVSGVAAAFVGKYRLTRTRHIFDASGYRCHFTASGRQDRTLLSLVSGRANGAGTVAANAIYGVVVAIVTNNDDPKKQGRVKVKFPWLSDKLESDWARLAQLGAGPKSGALFIPEVDDEVLVAFEHGDVHRPYVIGGLYNGKDRPNREDGVISSGKVARRQIVSRKGHRMVFFEDGGDSGILLESSDGKLRIALKESDQEVEIYCDGKVTITSKQDMKLTSQAGMSIQASGALEMKGSSVKVSGDASVEIKGQPIQLN